MTNEQLWRTPFHCGVWLQGDLVTRPIFLVEVDQIVCDSYLQTVVGLFSVKRSGFPVQYLGVTVRAWCVQWGLLGCDVSLSVSQA